MLTHFNTWCLKDIRKNKSGPKKKLWTLVFFFLYQGPNGAQNCWLILTPCSDLYFPSSALLMQKEENHRTNSDSCNILLQESTSLSNQVWLHNLILILANWDGWWNWPGKLSSWNKVTWHWCPDLKSASVYHRWVILIFLRKRQYCALGPSC